MCFLQPVDRLILTGILKQKTHRHLESFNSLKRITKQFSIFNCHKNSRLILYCPIASSCPPLLSRQILARSPSPQSPCYLHSWSNHRTPSESHRATAWGEPTCLEFAQNHFYPQWNNCRARPCFSLSCRNHHTSAWGLETCSTGLETRSTACLGSGRNHCDPHGNNPDKIFSVFWQMFWNVWCGWSQGDFKSYFVLGGGQPFANAQCMSLWHWGRLFL